MELGKGPNRPSSKHTYGPTPPPQGFQASKLSTLTELRELKSVFVDILRGHHALHQASGSIHASLSPSSLVFNRGIDGTAIGILIDLDPPCLPSSDSTRKHINEFRVGHAQARPFQALGIARQISTPAEEYLYRHNLESFIYLICWYTIRLNDTRARPRLVNRKMLQQNLMFSPGASYSLLQDGRDRWLSPLWRLLSEGYFLTRGVPPPSSTQEGRTLFGRLTFRKVITVLEDAMEPRLKTPRPPSDLPHVPFLLPLGQRQSLGELKKAFADIVEAHHRLRLEGQDTPTFLAPQHLMYHRGQGDTVSGVFVDCDPLPATSSQLLLRPRPSLNSEPYLALDLIRDPTFKPKYYRHDLEAFFYLLHRASVDARTVDRKPGKNNHCLRFDNMPFTWYVEKFGSSVRQEFAGLTDSWLIPLWKMIGDAYFFYEISPHTDSSTLNGHLTYNTFIGILRSVLPPEH